MPCSLPLILVACIAAVTRFKVIVLLRHSAMRTADFSTPQGMPRMCTIIPAEHEPSISSTVCSRQGSAHHAGSKQTSLQAHAYICEAEGWRAVSQWGALRIVSAA